MEFNWPKAVLGELIESFDSLRIPVKEAERRPGPFPYYGASGIIDYIDDFIFDGEYLLIAEDGENLRTRNTPVAFIASGKFWVNNHAHIVKGNVRALTKFLCYALAQTDIGAYLSGSTMPKLTQGNMLRIPIAIPPRHIQESIVDILSSLDDKIELNRRTNRTLEETAQAIFRSWFVDFNPVKAKMRAKELGLDPEQAAMAAIAGKIRVPKSVDELMADDFAAAEAALATLTEDQRSQLAETAALFPDTLVDSELGLVPEGWKIVSFNTLATLETTSIKPFQEPDKIWEHYSIPAFDDRGLPAFERGSDIKSNKYAVKPQAVLSSKLNPQFPRTWLPFVFDPEAAICSTEFMPFVPKCESDRPFIYGMVVSDPFQSGITERVSGSTGSRQRAKPGY